MNQIKDLFSGKTFEFTKSKRTERGDLISNFTQKINETRTGKYKPFKISYIAVLLASFRVSELYALWKTCSEGDHFQRLFWYLVKKKNNHENTLHKHHN